MDQNAELISRVEKNLQFFVFISKSYISGKGCDCGTTILFKSRKSMHNLDFLFSSFLYASVTGAVNGLYDSSISFLSSNLEICFSISFLSSIVHRYGLLLQYFSTTKSMCFVFGYCANIIFIFCKDWSIIIY